MLSLVIKITVKQPKGCYYITNISFTLPISAFDTSVVCVKRRLRAVDFLVKMWLLKADLRFTLPVPVTINLFFALDLVFTFGILVNELSVIKIVVLQPQYLYLLLKDKINNSRKELFMEICLTVEIKPIFSLY